VPGRLAVRTLTAAAAATALALSACADGSLETSAVELTSPTLQASASPGVERSDLPPVTPVTAAAMAHEATVQATLKPETASAIRDARAIRDAGNKARAIAMLEKTAGSDTDPALLLERGLLSLETGQIDRAAELLAQAHDPKAPDWRQHSGLGAALSAQGKQQAAQVEFAKALALAPDNPAVLNNLALSYALDGKHSEAERLLRQASDAQGGNAKAKQNLALIVGLRGNVDEARRLSEAVLPPEKVKSNVAYLEQLRSGTEKVSKADPVPTGEARAVAAVVQAEGSDAPIMQLGSPN
jgi:Flp pilus assembly protein TadD